MVVLTVFDEVGQDRGQELAVCPRVSIKIMQIDDGPSESRCGAERVKGNTRAEPSTVASGGENLRSDYHTDAGK